MNRVEQLKSCMTTGAVYTLAHVICNFPVQIPLLSPLLGALSMPIMIFALVYMTNKFRDQFLGGYITYGTAFRYGFSSISWGVIAIGVYSFFQFKYFNPDMLSEIKILLEEFYMNMDLPAAETKKMIETLDLLMVPKTIALANTVGGLFLGVIYSLISAAFSKKENPNPFQSIDNE